MVTRLKTLLEVEMDFRNEKQSLGCLKMSLKDSWSFSHLKLRISHLESNFALNFAPCFARCETISILKVMALMCQRGVSHGAKIFTP